MACTHHTTTPPLTSTSHAGLRVMIRVEALPAPVRGAFRRPWLPPDWTEKVRAHPDRIGKRADWIATHETICRVLVAFRRPDRLSRPTWARLAGTAQVDRRTVGRHLRWLRDRGFLRVDCTGISAYCTKDGIAQAAEYELVAGAVEARSFDPVELNVPPAARLGASSSPCGNSRSRCEPRQAAIVNTKARGAAARLQRRVLALRRTRIETIASGLNSWWEAGWTVEDMCHALDHEPDGSVVGPWHLEAIKGPMQVVHARLTPWRGLPPPVTTRMQLTRKARQQRIEQAQLERAKHAAARAEGWAAAADGAQLVRDAARAARLNPKSTSPVAGFVADLHHLRA